jgi:hypothetical protein
MGVGGWFDCPKCGMCHNSVEDCPDITLYGILAHVDGHGDAYAVDPDELVAMLRVLVERTERDIAVLTEHVVFHRERAWGPNFADVREASSALWHNAEARRDGLCSVLGTRPEVVEENND